MTLPGNRSDYMWYWFNYDTPAYGAKPVGTRLQNQFGLYDMSGNELEWCQDWHHSSYSGAPTDGTVWEAPSIPYRVVRGGYWGLSARCCRSAYRFGYAPSYRYSFLGLRLVAVR